MNINTKLSYTSLQSLPTPKLITKATHEQRYWKKYQTYPLSSNTQGSINAIASNHNSLNLIIFAQGRSVNIVQPTQHSIVKSLTHFDSIVTALAIRKDGKIMAIGDESGKIEIIDTKEKFHLRNFKNHKKRINALDYDGNNVYSGGQDMIIRLFDIASGNVIHSYQQAHSDYIKCLKGLENNHLLSGSYDGTVKLFDFRVHQAPQRIFNHGNQVQAIDLFPSLINFIACGDKKITSWDLRSEKPIFENQSHKKTVNSVKVVSEGSRFISTSSDGYFKVYQGNSFEVTYQQKQQKGILCFDVTQNNLHMAIGLENQKFILKSRGNQRNKNQDTEDQEIEEEIGLWLNKNQQNKFAYNNKYFYRGIYDKPVSFDIKFEREKNQKITQYDKFLKKFQYKRALFTALNKKNMVMFLALIDQYIQRGCLDKTIKSCSNEEAAILMDKLCPLIHDIRYSEVAILVLHKIIQLDHLKMDSVWINSIEHVRKQLKTVEQLAKLEGMLELIENSY